MFFISLLYLLLPLPLTSLLPGLQENNIIAIRGLILRRRKERFQSGAAILYHVRNEHIGDQEITSVC